MQLRLVLILTLFRTFSEKQFKEIHDELRAINGEVDKQFKEINQKVEKQFKEINEKVEKQNAMLVQLLAIATSNNSNPGGTAQPEHS